MFSNFMSYEDLLNSLKQACKTAKDQDRDPLVKHCPYFSSRDWVFVRKSLENPWLMSLLKLYPLPRYEEVLQNTYEIRRKNDQSEDSLAVKNAKRPLSPDRQLDQISKRKTQSFTPYPDIAALFEPFIMPYQGSHPTRRFSFSERMRALFLKCVEYQTYFRLNESCLQEDLENLREKYIQHRLAHHVETVSSEDIHVDFKAILLGLQNQTLTMTPEMIAIGFLEYFTEYPVIASTPLTDEKYHALIQKIVQEGGLICEAHLNLLLTIVSQNSPIDGLRILQKEALSSPLPKEIENLAVDMNQQYEKYLKNTQYSSFPFYHHRLMPAFLSQDHEDVYYSEEALIEAIAKHHVNIDLPALTYIATFCATAGYAKTLEFLLKKHPLLHTQESLLNSLLWTAMKYHHSDFVRILVSSCEKLNLNTTDMTGMNILMWAASLGDDDIVKTLVLHRGMSPFDSVSSYSTYHGYTPFYLAYSNNHKKLATDIAFYQYLLRGQTEIMVRYHMPHIITNAHFEEDRQKIEAQIVSLILNKNQKDLVPISPSIIKAIFQKCPELHTEENLSFLSSVFVDKNVTFTIPTPPTILETNQSPILMSQSVEETTQRVEVTCRSRSLGCTIS